MNADFRWTIDTNILIYSVDLDSGYKHAIARDVLGAVARNDGILTVQVLGEFYHSTTRKNLLSHQAAERFVLDWRAVFNITAANETCLRHAITATQSHKLSFWDAMLCTTAQLAGCDAILSEDMQHGWSFGSLKIVNPFADDAAQWITRLFGNAV